MSKFVDQVSILGLRIKEVKGDGNCLFRSISDQIEGSDDNHKYYRKAACDYMKDNEDHFKFFLTDDKSFDKYVSDMLEDGIWGGNLELYAISMRFQVNIYIHIYNHPMYIIKNYNDPMKNIQLSYHDGEHYNSIRLKDDFEVNSIKDIPIELINQVEKTDTADNIISQDETNEDEQKEEPEYSKENQNKNSENTLVDEETENKDKNEETENDQKLETKGDEIIYKDYIIIDQKKLPDKKKNKFVLTKQGHFTREVQLNKKCHCNSGKKYKNCCCSSDLSGFYDSQTHHFYCDINEFLVKFKDQLEEKKDEKSNKNSKSENGNVTNTLTNQFEKIYI